MANMPAHVGERAPQRPSRAIALHLALDQVRDDLGVRLGLELVPCDWSSFFRSR
jgi:hypothetical protein